MLLTFGTSNSYVLNIYVLSYAYKKYCIYWPSFYLLGVYVYIMQQQPQLINRFVVINDEQKLNESSAFNCAIMVCLLWRNQKFYHFSNMILWDSWEIYKGG